jgi:DNA-binding PadR family transcriptional regulator
MGKLERIYRRTEIGRKALQDGDPQLSPEQQRILALLECDTHWDEIRKVLRRQTDYQRLLELEAEGYVASIAAEAESDLDFTSVAFGS